MIVPAKPHRTNRGASPRAPSSSRRRIQPYIACELHDRLDEYCALKKETASAVVEAALNEYLDQARDDLLVLRRLDRLGRSIERVSRDLELLSQGFALFVQFWFAQAPAVAPNQRDAARRVSAGRFKQFMEQIAQQFSRGHRFLDDLPKEQFADDSDLEAIAKIEDPEAGKGRPS